MDHILSDFIFRNTVMSNDGMVGENREAFKLFYVSNHGIGVSTILQKMRERTDSRTLATPRILGFLYRDLSRTKIGNLFILGCSDKKRILYNQYKKWHFPNYVNNKGDATAFNVYPYWIILEFLTLAAKKGIASISKDEYSIFVATIRHRDYINMHLETLFFLRNNEDQREEFYSQLPDAENLFNRFSKSGFHELLSVCLEHITYDETTEQVSLSNNDTEYLINMVNYFYQHYDRYANFNENSDYFRFLSSNHIDNTFNIFPMPNNFPSDSYNSVSTKIVNDYPFSNILLKGVPGTGKSRKIEEILNKNIFGLKDGEAEDECLTTSVLKHKNVVRINIHSGLSNSELMQGIGVLTTDNNEIKYYEKRGVLLKHIAKAILNPSLPYVIILEEIQENNLNRLIGDLIFLIEEDRRVEFDTNFTDMLDSEIDFSFVSEQVVQKANLNKVLLPSLIEDSQEIFLCMPKNLYVFCTSNYRDDKKIMEDNMLRRFEIIDLFPDKTAISNPKVAEFFSKMNDNILLSFDEKFEIHPDRFLIGHAIWLNVNDDKTFCKALNKVAIDFKDLKEVDFLTFKNIITASGVQIDQFNNYQELLVELQNFFFNDVDLQSQPLKNSITSIFMTDETI